MNEEGMKREELEQEIAKECTTDAELQGGSVQVEHPDAGHENDTAESPRQMHAEAQAKNAKRGRKRGKYAKRMNWMYVLWAAVFVAAGVLIGIWIGRSLVLNSITNLDTTIKEPTLVSDKVVTMESMNWVYTQGAPYRPNAGYSEVFFGAQLFNSNDYVVYIQDTSGEIWHTTLAQCKLSVSDENPNTVHIKQFEGVQHPYIVFALDADEFASNVSPLFMEGFTDGMVNFVYQFLAETLPVTE